jgi:hypothetical protein
MGPVTVSEATRKELVDHAQESLAQAGGGVDTAAMTQEMLQLIVSTREYQLA